MPPSQHVGASCLCLSGSEGARLSPALNSPEHQALLCQLLPAESWVSYCGVGGGGPLFYIYFKKKSPKGVETQSGLGLPAPVTVLL